MWSLAGSQALDQSIYCFGPESCGAGGSALGLSCVLPAVPATLGLWVGQLASVPGAHPPKVSGVGAQQGFQLWVPSQLIWVRPTRLQGRAGAAYPGFPVQGLRGEGHQRRRLLQRVL